MVWNKVEGGQAEVVRTCHEKRLGVYRKKSDGNKVTSKEEKRRPKRKFLDVVKENKRKVAAKETDVKNRSCG